MSKSVTLPTGLKWRLTRPLVGGPRFDFPQYGLYKIDFSKLTDNLAACLHAAGWDGIEPIPEKEVKAPKDATPSTPGIES